MAMDTSSCSAPDINDLLAVAGRVREPVRPIALGNLANHMIRPMLCEDVFPNADVDCLM